MTSLSRAIQIMKAAGHDWVPIKIATLKGTKMATKSVGKVKLKTDKTTGKTKLTRVHTYDASKARKIAKAKTKRVVPGQRLNTSVDGLRGGQQRTSKRSMR